MPTSPPDVSLLPLLSIVLIVRDPGDAPDKVLEALAASAEIGSVEVIVVDGRPEPPALGQFDIPLLSRITVRPENMPRLKAIGAGAARGATVAFLEPKAAPDPVWVGVVLAACRDNPENAIGGAVVFGGARTVADQAAFIFEYGAFSPDQLRSGRTRDLPGNNMAMPKAKLLDLCSDILEREGLNKPFCQQRLIEGNVSLSMNPAMLVAVTTKHRVRSLLTSRFNYARCFGGTRIVLASPSQRLFYRLGAPAIPFMLLARHLRAMRRADVGPRLRGVSLALAALCFAWAVGETAGYWFGRRSSCRCLY